MGGSISAQNKWSGTGAIFEFTLPLKQITEKEYLDSVPDSRVFDREEIDFSTIKILVAEDNTINQKVITRILNKLDCQSEIAMNGLDALTKVEQVA